MAFQFQCPQEHLLEGEESQAGQAINCPVCGMLFIIPEPVSAAAPEAPAATPPEPEPPAEPELLHIACPSGHVLEVPPEMLDTEVLCPHCSVQFRLRAKDSVEHRQRREEAEVLRDAKTNKFFYQFAIGVAVVVGLLLLTLTIMSAFNRKRADETKPSKATSKPKPAKVKPAEEPMEEPAEDNPPDTEMSEEK